MLVRVSTWTRAAPGAGRGGASYLHKAHHSIVRGQLMERIEKRIRDGSVLQLIRKWIQIGVIDDGRLLVSETGTGQGQTISPLLANIYLHYGAPG